jgi:hypothetical protein
MRSTPFGLPVRTVPRVSGRVCSRGLPCVNSRVLSGRSGGVETAQEGERVVTVGPAHFMRWLKRHTDGGSFRKAEKGAAQVGQELHAADAGRFSFRHARDGRRDRRRDAAGATALPADTLGRQCRLARRRRGHQKRTRCLCRSRRHRLATQAVSVTSGHRATSG